jgi:hypothetical protein
MGLQEVDEFFEIELPGALKYFNRIARDRFFACLCEYALSGKLETFQ